MNEITNEEDYDMVLLEYNVEHPELTDKYKTHIIRWTLVEEVIDYFDVVTLVSWNKCLDQKQR